MGEYRLDITTGEWVVISTERGRRPHESAQKLKPQLPEYDAECPFCPGNESLTPPEIMAYRNSNGGWRLRVIPNMFPAVSSHPFQNTGNDLFPAYSAAGVHEIIIESPNHARPFFLSDENETEYVVRAYLDRYRELEKDPANRMIFIFRNQGEMAGASIVHPHSQIIATRIVSEHMARRLSVAEGYQKSKGRCLYCDMIENEKASRRLIELGKFLVFCPFASRYPYETWIIPSFHQSSFGEIPDGDSKVLACALSRTLKRIHTALKDPDFNMIIHSFPHHSFHWFIQIVPRLTIPAGFEIGSGIYINPAEPEEVAAHLIKGI